MSVGPYVVKEIVALHGGTIEVESQEGSRSTFAVCLPLLETERVPIAETPGSSP